MLGLAGAAGLAIASKKLVLPMSPSTLALLAIMAGLITGCVFVAQKPGEAGYVGVGPSFWMFGAGAVRVRHTLIAGRVVHADEPVFAT